MPICSQLTLRLALTNQAVAARLSFGGEPSTSEAGTPQSAAQVRILAHHAPNEPGVPILNHGDDRALVDAEVVACDPTETWDAPSVHERNVEVEARIEGIEKTIIGVN